MNNVRALVMKKMRVVVAHRSFLRAVRGGWPPPSLHYPSPYCSSSTFLALASSTHAVIVKLGPLFPYRPDERIVASCMYLLIYVRAVP